jgi:hypothetical protein
MCLGFVHKICIVIYYIIDFFIDQSLKSLYIFNEIFQLFYSLIFFQSKCQIYYFEHFHSTAILMNISHSISHQYSDSHHTSGEGLIGFFNTSNLFLEDCILLIIDKKSNVVFKYSVSVSFQCIVCAVWINFKLQY